MLSQQPHQHTRSALCRFYNQQPSGCLKGDNCPYQHIAADSNSTESNRHANLNDVKSSKRSTICRYYRRNGKCNRGDRCHFLHDTIDTPTASSSSTGEDTQTILERSITQKLTSHYGDQFKGLIKSKKNPENEHDTSSLGKRCTTTTAHLCFVPTDPDFSFDLEILDISLDITIPTTSNNSSSSKHEKECRDLTSYELQLQVLNKDIPFGIARNIEVSFHQHVRQNSNQTICAQLDWLINGLERLLQLPSASAFKFVALKPAERSQTSDDKATAVQTAATSSSSSTSTDINPMARGGERRQKELKQIERRFRSSIEWISKSSSTSNVNDQTVDQFQLTIRPTDPDYKHPYLTLQLNIRLPINYPDSSLQLRIVNKEMPREKARTVEHAFHQHLQKHQSTLSILRALNWLDHQLNDLLALPGRLESDEEEEEDEENVVNKTAMKLTTLTLAGQSPINKSTSKQKKGYDSDEYSNNTTDTDDSDTPAELADTMMTTPIRRGTEIKWIKGERKGIEFLRCTSLNLSLQCGRCRRPFDVKGLKGATTAQSGEKHMACGVCRNTMSIRYRADAVHDGSATLGYLDLDGCRVVDMLPCSFAITCDDCSLEQTPISLANLPRGQPTTVFCRGCHHPMTLNVDQIKFQRLTLTGIATAKDATDINAIETVGGLQARQRLKDTVKDYAPGKPLPEHGTCKHYRRSHRWMRFPCCGKCYPCDVCHDTSEDHQHERANRMICGYCSLEQPFADRVCPCGAVMGHQKQREFWEGGSGMRNRTQMNRRDPHKYKGTLKTVSKKKQQLQ